jgi:hypothetical protein
MNTDLPGHGDLVPINCVSLRDAVVEEFHQTMSRAEFIVHTVFRIQNISIWNDYVVYVLI